MATLGTVGDPNWIPVSVLYNHTVWSSEKSDALSTPLEEGEQIVLDRTYKTKAGHAVTMCRKVSPCGQEYFLGYRFIGDNCLYYKEDGSTHGPKDPKLPDDITEKLI